VVEFSARKQARAAPSYATKLKNVRPERARATPSGADEKVERQSSDKREMHSYLYRDGAKAVRVLWTNVSTTSSCRGAALGEAASPRQGGGTRGSCLSTTASRRGRIARARGVTVSATEPGLQGPRFSGARKPATLTRPA